LDVPPSNCLGLVFLSGLRSLQAQTNWEPTKSVEFIVPAGTGGGADQMARFLQGVITKHKLMTQPLVVVNKAGGAGAEGFLDAKSARPDGHKIIITLSNLFTTPLATGVPFNWKDLTPVAMLALDEFVFWVNAESPYKNVNDLSSDQASRIWQIQNGWNGLETRRPDHHGRY
jgi:tripartite-type tricarboxylate transporter receptor subunit TctC